MANKFMLLTSLFILLSSQQNSVWADYSSPSVAAEDDFERADALGKMKAVIGDFDSTKLVLSEDNQSNDVTKREEPSTNERLSDWLISSLINPVASLIMEDTEDEMLTRTLAQKLLLTNPKSVTPFDILSALRDVSSEQALRKLNSTDLLLTFLGSQTTPFGAQWLVDDELTAKLGTQLQFSSQSPSTLANLILAIKNVSPWVETYMTYETPD